MIFTRTHQCQSPYKSDELKRRLIGDRVKIHNLDFEAIEDDSAISIFPNTDQISEIKTLPITRVDMQDRENGSHITITSKIRAIDLGGAQLVMILCFLLFLVSAILLTVFKGEGNKLAGFIVLGVGVLTFTLFWIRLQNGYFDYVKKVKHHVLAKVQ